MQKNIFQKIRIRFYLFIGKISYNKLNEEKLFTPIEKNNIHIAYRRIKSQHTI